MMLGRVGHHKFVPVPVVKDKKTANLRTEVIALEKQLAEALTLERREREELDAAKDRLQYKKNQQEEVILRETAMLRSAKHEFERCNTAKKILEQENQKIDTGLLDIRRLHLEENLGSFNRSKDDAINIDGGEEISYKTTLEKMFGWYRQIYGSMDSKYPEDVKSFQQSPRVPGLKMSSLRKPGDLAMRNLHSDDYHGDLHRSAHRSEEAHRSGDAEHHAHRSEESYYHGGRGPHQTDDYPVDHPQVPVDRIMSSESEGLRDHGKHVGIMPDNLPSGGVLPGGFPGPQAGSHGEPGSHGGVHRDAEIDVSAESQTGEGVAVSQGFHTVGGLAEVLHLLKGFHQSLFESEEFVKTMSLNITLISNLDGLLEYAYKEDYPHYAKFVEDIRKELNRKAERSYAAMSAPDSDFHSVQCEQRDVSVTSEQKIEPPVVEVYTMHTHQRDVSYFDRGEDEDGRHDSGIGRPSANAAPRSEQEFLFELSESEKNHLHKGVSMHSAMKAQDDDLSEKGRDHVLHPSVKHTTQKSSYVRDSAAMGDGHWGGDSVNLDILVATSHGLVELTDPHNNGKGISVYQKAPSKDLDEKFEDLVNENDGGTKRVSTLQDGFGDIDSDADHVTASNGFAAGNEKGSLGMKNLSQNAASGSIAPISNNLRGGKVAQKLRVSQALRELESHGLQELTSYVLDSLLKKLGKGKHALREGDTKKEKGLGARRISSTEWMLIGQSAVIGGESRPMLGGESRPMLGGESRPMMGGESRHMLGEESRPMMGGESRHMMGGDSRHMIGGESRPMMGVESRPMLGEESRPMTGGGSRPVMGGESRPMIGGESRPMMGGESRNMMGGESRPMLGEESRPMLGEKSRPMIGGESRLMGDASTFLTLEQIAFLEGEEEADLLLLQSATATKLKAGSSLQRTKLEDGGVGSTHHDADRGTANDTHHHSGEGTASREQQHRNHVSSTSTGLHHHKQGDASHALQNASGSVKVHSQVVGNESVEVPSQSVGSHFQGVGMHSHGARSHSLSDTEQVRGPAPLETITEALESTGEHHVTHLQTTTHHHSQAFADRQHQHHRVPSQQYDTISHGVASSTQSYVILPAQSHGLQPTQSQGMLPIQSHGVHSIQSIQRSQHVAQSVHSHGVQSVQGGTHSMQHETPTMPHGIPSMPHGHLHHQLSNNQVPDVHDPRMMMVNLDPHLAMVNRREDMTQLHPAAHATSTSDSTQPHQHDYGLGSPYSESYIPSPPRTPSPQNRSTSPAGGSPHRSASPPSHRASSPGRARSGSPGRASVHGILPVPSLMPAYGLQVGHGLQRHSAPAGCSRPNRDGMSARPKSSAARRSSPNSVLPHVNVILAERMLSDAERERNRITQEEAKQRARIAREEAKERYASEQERARVAQEEEKERHRKAAEAEAEEAARHAEEEAARRAKEEKKDAEQEKFDTAVTQLHNSLLQNNQRICQSIQEEEVLREEFAQQELRKRASIRNELEEITNEHSVRMDDMLQKKASARVKSSRLEDISNRTRPSAEQISVGKMQDIRLEEVGRHGSFILEQTRQESMETQPEAHLLEAPLGSDASWTRGPGGSGPGNLAGGSQALHGMYTGTSISLQGGPGRTSLPAPGAALPRPGPGASPGSPSLQAAFRSATESLNRFVESQASLQTRAIERSSSALVESSAALLHSSPAFRPSQVDHEGRIRRNMRESDHKAVNRTRQNTVDDQYGHASAYNMHEMRTTSGQYGNVHTTGSPGTHDRQWNTTNRSSIHERHTASVITNDTYHTAFQCTSVRRASDPQARVPRKDLSPEHAAARNYPSVVPPSPFRDNIRNSNYQECPPSGKDTSRQQSQPDDGDDVSQPKNRIVQKSLSRVIRTGIISPEKPELLVPSENRNENRYSMANREEHKTRLAKQNNNIGNSLANRVDGANLPNQEHADISSLVANGNEARKRQIAVSVVKKEANIVPNAAWDRNSMATPAMNSVLKNYGMEPGHRNSFNIDDTMLRQNTVSRQSLQQIGGSTAIIEKIDYSSDMSKMSEISNVQGTGDLSKRPSTEGRNVQEGGSVSVQRRGPANVNAGETASSILQERTSLQAPNSNVAVASNGANCQTELQPSVIATRTQPKENAHYHQYDVLHRDDARRSLHHVTDVFKDETGDTGHSDSTARGAGDNRKENGASTVPSNDLSENVINAVKAAVVKQYSIGKGEVAESSTPTDKMDASITTVKMDDSTATAKAEGSLAAVADSVRVDAIRTSATSTANVRTSATAEPDAIRPLATDKSSTVGSTAAGIDDLIDKYARLSQRSQALLEQNQRQFKDSNDVVIGTHNVATIRSRDLSGTNDLIDSMNILAGIDGVVDRRHLGGEKESENKFEKEKLHDKDPDPAAQNSTLEADEKKISAEDYLLNYDVKKKKSGSVKRNYTSTNLPNNHGDIHHDKDILNRNVNDMARRNEVLHYDIVNSNVEPNPTEGPKKNSKGNNKYFINSADQVLEDQVMFESSSASNFRGYYDHTKSGFGSPNGRNSSGHVSRNSNRRSNNRFVYYYPEHMTSVDVSTYSLSIDVSPRESVASDLLTDTKNTHRRKPVRSLCGLSIEDIDNILPEAGEEESNGLMVIRGGK